MPSDPLARERLTMTFIRFDLDYDSIRIDDQVIIKPRYLSASQWLSFWNFTSSEEFEEAKEKSFRDGTEESEREHEKELEGLKDAFDTEIGNLYRYVDKAFENYEWKPEEKRQKILEKIEEIDNKQWLW